ncbi:hypothetical protein H2201_002356 [Coniosporium apollinis]|uniref:F-box domain-containing protein n=1 Tax=Coniosporium apollinis TaxID=61459 RepID=A0ABQ9NYM7_9PEZI|nr:hypothetical protein H2201_002356 [Coniosporium apollinis]
MPLLQWHGFRPAGQSALGGSMRLVPASTLTHASSYRSEESARAQPKPFRLMDLPGELRDIIYGFVVTRNHPICPHRLLREQEGQEGSDYQFHDIQLPYPGRKPTDPITRSTLNLAATSRQVQSEIGEMFYEKNTFDFSHNMRDLVPFIDCLDARGKAGLLHKIIFSLPTADPRELYAHWPEADEYPQEFWLERPGFEFSGALFRLSMLESNVILRPGRWVSHASLVTLQVSGVDLSVPNQHHLEWLTPWLWPDRLVVKILSDAEGRKVDDPATEKETETGRDRDAEMTETNRDLDADFTETSQDQDAEETETGPNVGGYSSNNLTYDNRVTVTWPFQEAQAATEVFEHTTMGDGDWEAFWQHPLPDAVVLPTADGQSSIAFVRAPIGLQDIEADIQRRVCEPYGHLDPWRCACGFRMEEEPIPAEMPWELLQSRVPTQEAAGFLMERFRSFNV